MKSFKNHFEKIIMVLSKFQGQLFMESLPIKDNDDTDNDNDV